MFKDEMLFVVELRQCKVTHRDSRVLPPLMINRKPDIFSDMYSIRSGLGTVLIEPIRHATISLCYCQFLFVLLDIFNQASGIHLFEIVV